MITTPPVLSCSKDSPSFRARREGRASTSSAWAVVGAVMLAGSAHAQVLAAPAPTASAPVDYADDANWLCLPGRDDPCSAPLPTTALNANGYGSSGLARPAAEAKADCFYVYPTISGDPAPNSDLVPDAGEKGAATVQFARFGSVCRTFAPMYRQATLAALRSSMTGKPQGDLDLAYGDVKAAFAQFRTARSKDRPFVLIGHSQGSFLLQRLIAEEIEGKPEAAHMLSAIIPGFNAEVPEGKLTGGTFKTTPLCTSVGERGCVISYVSFPAGATPPAVGLLGRSYKPGMTVACTNPAGLAAGKAPLDSYWFTGKGAMNASAPPIAWSRSGDPPTPFVHTEGLATAQCRSDGAAGWLEVGVNADPADTRTDTLPGQVFAAGKPLADWGLHLADIDLAQGSLIALVEAQVASEP